MAVPPLRYGCGRPPAYNGAVGYLISAAEGQTSVNLTDPQWRALIYVVSKHGFSAPHLRLEGKDETLEVDRSDAEGLRSALGLALEARGAEEIRTPDGELDYYTVQRVGFEKYAGFMKEIGLIDNTPGFWEDLVFDNLKNTKGS